MLHTGLSTLSALRERHSTTTSHTIPSSLSPPACFPGVQLTQVSAYDQDDPETPNAQLTYSLGDQIPNKHNTPLFQIDAQSGWISITEEGNHTHVHTRSQRLAAERDALAERAVICPSLPVIWPYSAALKPDYSAHPM